MDSLRFDRLTRSFSAVLSRRTLAAALSLSVLGVPPLAETKKQHKKGNKKQKVKRNDFGCVNVGGFCKNDDQCCSGICAGKQEKRKCRAHDQDTCQPGQQQPFCNPGQVETSCTTSTGEAGICETTTGKAPYCQSAAGCFPCQKDADCVPHCGPQAACMLCSGCIQQAGTETACVGPRSCTFPAM